MPLTASFTMISSYDLTSVLDLVTGTAALRNQQKIDFTNGTGANKAETAFSDQRTVSGSSTDSLDLSGGLTDIYGNSLTFTKIKAIIIRAATANGGTLQLTAPSTNGLAALFTAKGDALKIKPGGLVAIVAPDAAGYAVTASTADLLDIINDDASSATYDIIIIGETS